MMRSMRNKVVQATQSVAREAQETARDVVGNVAEEVMNRKAPPRKKRSYPSVSNKRKPERVRTQSRSRPRKKKRATPYDVFDAAA